MSESEVDSGDNKLELLWAALVCFKYIRYMYMLAFVKSTQTLVSTFVHIPLVSLREYIMYYYLKDISSSYCYV